MGSKIIKPSPALFNGRDQFELFDHFVSFTDAQLWTLAVAGTGTVAHEGPGRSRIKFFNTAANDAAVLATTHGIFKFTASKAIMGEGNIIFTDVDTDDGIVGFGFADALAATSMANTTGAITATDAALIYKLPDTTVWAFHTEINGTAVSTTSNTTAGGSAAQTLRIEIVPRSSTVFEARPYVDGVQLITSAGVPIKHDITLGTATDMKFGFIQKSNDAADFTMYADYAYAAQVI